MADLSARRSAWRPGRPLIARDQLFEVASQQAAALAPGQTHQCRIGVGDPAFDRELCHRIRRSVQQLRGERVVLVDRRSQRDQQPRAAVKRLSSGAEETVVAVLTFGPTVPAGFLDDRLKLIAGGAHGSPGSAPKGRTQATPGWVGVSNPPIDFQHAGGHSHGIDERRRGCPPLRIAFRDDDGPSHSKSLARGQTPCPSVAIDGRTRSPTRTLC